MLRFDTLIIGSGLAGLSLALKLADKQKVAIITKKSLLDGASVWAQGGIAAVLSPDDSLDEHIHDTMIAGAGLCDPKTTSFVIEHGASAIDWLIAQGVPFTRDAGSDSGYHLTREGGHSRRRIIHAADATGQAVQETIAAKVRTHPNITLLEHYIAVDLITAGKLGRHDNRTYGAYALNSLSEEVVTIAARTRFSPPAEPAKSICTRRIRIPPPATVSPWAGAPAAASPTWNSSSSILRASTTRMPNRSSSARQCAAKAAS